MSPDPATYTQTSTPLPPSRRMRARFLHEIAAAGLPQGPGPSAPVTDASIADLPAVVQRYLRFMGAVGRPRVWSLRARWTGLFRMRPDRPWLPCEAWQYDTRLDLARLFHMRLRFGGIMPMLVRDTYLRGEGRMVGRVLDAVPVVDAADDKITTGELVTYLNDAILLAPSLVLGPEATWAAVDDGAFDVALTDRGRTVQARVFIDDHGAVTDFRTTDRYGADPSRPGTLIRARWSTPVSGWRQVGGRRVASSATATWHFPSGDFPYADFSLSAGDLTFDVAPDAG